MDHSYNQHNSMETGSRFANVTDCAVVHCMVLLLDIVLIFKDLLYRRMRSLANFESANKKLEQAKTKNKGLAEVCVYMHMPKIDGRCFFFSG